MGTDIHPDSKPPGTVPQRPWCPQQWIYTHEGWKCNREQRRLMMQTVATNGMIMNTLSVHKPCCQDSLSLRPDDKSRAMTLSARLEVQNPPGDHFISLISSLMKCTRSLTALNINGYHTKRLSWMCIQETPYAHTHFSPPLEPPERVPVCLPSPPTCWGRPQSQWQTAGACWRQEATALQVSLPCLG